MSTISSGTTSTTTLIHSGDTTGSLVFKTNDTGSGGTTAMTIDTSQNLNFAGKISFSYNTAYYNQDNQISNYAAANYLYVSGNGTSTGGLYLQGGGNQKQNIILDGNSAGGNIAFATNGSERMRIDSSGNLLVGKTALNTGNGFQYAPNDGGTGIGALNITGNSSSNSNNAFLLYSSALSQYQFYVGYGGTISARSTSISALSDQREKTNIRVLETGLKEVLALQPRRFDWIDNTKKDVAGFIAQEVQQVLPDLIDDYKHDTEDRIGLRMGDILPTMVKAIQELKALVDTQATEIAELKAKT